ncbi:hypothetical protein [Altericroceibacterium spongiae]|nr:hypothetical protein [Altericroceibacterium spongiae]
MQHGTPPDPYWDAKEKRAARRWLAAIAAIVLIILATGARAFWLSL